MGILLLGLGACAPVGEAALTCSAEVDPDVPTVVDVTWEADGPSHVEFGVTDALGRSTPTESGTTHTLPLYGLPPETTIHWRAVTDGVGACEGTTVTGRIPSDYPSITITVDEPDRSPDPWWFGSLFQFMGDTPRVAAFDRSTGEYAWTYTGDPGMVTVDAQFVAGTNDVYFNQFNASFSEDTGNLRRVTLGGEVVGQWATPLAHHMFEQLPDGKVAFQSLDKRPWTDPETEQVLDLIGDRVMELDVADGTSAEVFTVWDWLEPVRTRHWEQVSLYPDGVDWTHGNAIKYYADDDRYLLSLGHADVLIEFGRADGQLRQMYGVEGIPVAEGDLAFDYQHDPSWTAAGTLTMFSTNPADEASGAIEYELRDGELHELWSFGVHGGDLQPLALGQVTRLSNGNTLIGYGIEGAIREVTPDGRVVWEAKNEAANGFANGRLLTDWYAP